MLQKAISAGLIMLFTAMSPALADELIVDGINKASSEQPKSGLSKADVASKWGEPTAEKSAVGEPPISSWEYEGFVVYFEADKVLHTVAKR
ncbi:MAG: hypothetical protein ACR2QG_06030 [Gammaproteobacteria bacterium]